MNVRIQKNIFLLFNMKGDYRETIIL